MPGRSRLVKRRDQGGPLGTTLSPSGRSSLAHLARQGSFRRAVLAGLAIVGLGVGNPGAVYGATLGDHGAGLGAPRLPRGETLYTSGTMYGPPSNFNPLDADGSFSHGLTCGGNRACQQPSGPLPGVWQGPYATGTMGLIYEPLFLYDPARSSYIPWLATGGSWVGANYVLHVRNGVKWSDGAALSGADVAYTINLARTNPGVPWRELAQLGLRGARAHGNTVTVSFAGQPPYAAWQRYLWTAPVLPEHIWSERSPSEQLSWANARPVGSGPMLLDYYGSSEVVYRVNPAWWGTAKLGLHFKFKYLVDTLTGSTGSELTKLLSGDIDWSNAFLPGAANVLSSRSGANVYNIVAYHQSPPYMLPTAAAWLVPNTERAPMTDVEFRRALAWALDPAAIATEIYSAAPPMSPIGLSPALSSYIDKGIVAKYGFSYAPKRAEEYLKKSGYKGKLLTLAVPSGLADLSAGAAVVAKELAAVGIKVRVAHVSYGDWEADLARGDYDLTIDGQRDLDATPWSYFNRIYALPVGGRSDEEAWGLNPEFYTSSTDWALVKQAAVTTPEDMAKLRLVYGQLEKSFLQGLPVVPLWYGQAWAQANTSHWSHFPSSSDRTDEYTPVMWPGWLGGATTVLALAQLWPNKR